MRRTRLIAFRVINLENINTPIELKEKNICQRLTYPFCRLISDEDERIPSDGDLKKKNQKLKPSFILFL